MREAICHRCKYARNLPKELRMDCSYDPLNPVNIVDRSRSGFCPAGKFPASDEQIEELLERDKTEGGCGCDGSGTTDVEIPK
jgi:hypothetical protein